jgi:hypothetical protein
MKITLIAAIPEYYLTTLKREDLGNIEKVAPYLSFTQTDMSSIGHVRVGTVEVDVEIVPPDEIIGNAVLALRQKAKEIRAKATAECTALEAKAQQLLAIENRT